MERHRAVITILALSLGLPLGGVDALPLDGPVDNYVDHVPLSWSAAKQTFFDGKIVDIPSGIMVATDGATFFYATSYGWKLGEETTTRCSEARPIEDLPFALLGQDACMWVEFPSVACWQTDVCATAAGVIPPGPAAPPPMSGGVGVLTATNYNYVQAGVTYAAGSTIYGVSSTIAMNGGIDTYSLSDCHYRWGGMEHKGSYPETFMQAGTYQCQSPDGGTNHWHVFCYGWDNTPTSGQWQFFESFVTRSDTSWHTYDVARHSLNSLTYDCRFDGVTKKSHIALLSGFSGMSVEAIGEIGSSSVGIDPAQETFKASTFEPTARYLTSGGTWTSIPSSKFVEWTWNSNPPYPGQNACPLFNMGVTINWLAPTWPSITVGQGQTCQPSGGTAW